jgi:regulator of replication initiation timing
MEAMDILEKKIIHLLEIVQKLKKENSQLVQENLELQSKVKTLDVLMQGGQQELDSEKEKARLFVDGLIKSIDSLVETEQNQ